MAKSPINGEDLTVGEVLHFDGQKLTIGGIFHLIFSLNSAKINNRMGSCLGWVEVR